MKKKTILRALLNITLAFGAILVVFPFYLTVVSSLKDMSDIFSNFFGLPKKVVWDNFSYVLQRPDYFIALKNSAVITGVSIMAMVVFLPMCAYAISRRRFQSKFYNFLYFFMVAGIFIPFQVKLLPMVKLMSQLGLLNRQGAILLYIANSTCEGIFLLVGYLSSLPTDLEEAAYIDGASPFTTFIRIVFPLLKPPMVTLLIVIALRVWNNFMYPLLLLQGQNSRTLPLTVFFFKGDLSIQWNILFAATTLVILPLMIVYFILQKQIISGMLNGSVKG